MAGMLASLGTPVRSSSAWIFWLAGARSRGEGVHDSTVRSSSSKMRSIVVESRLEALMES